MLTSAGKWGPSTLFASTPCLLCFCCCCQCCSSRQRGLMVGWSRGKLLREGSYQGTELSEPRACISTRKCRETRTKAKGGFQRRRKEGPQFHLPLPIQYGKQEGVFALRMVCILPEDLSEFFPPFFLQAPLSSFLTASPNSFPIRNFCFQEQRTRAAKRWEAYQKSSDPRGSTGATFPCPLFGEQRSCLRAGPGQFKSQGQTQIADFQANDYPLLHTTFSTCLRNRFDLASLLPWPFPSHLCCYNRTTMKESNSEGWRKTGGKQ